MRRAVAGGDIALVNGGGIEEDLDARDIIYGDIIAVHPYGIPCVWLKRPGKRS